nr:immunoglobulin light chain junction region [Macaca mulatta]
CQHYISAPFTF